MLGVLGVSADEKNENPFDVIIPAQKDLATTNYCHPSLGQMCSFFISILNLLPIKIRAFKIKIKKVNTFVFVACTSTQLNHPSLQTS